MRPNKNWKPCLVFAGLLLLAVCAGVGAPPASAAGPAQTQTRPLLRVATGRIAPFVFKQGQQLTGFSIDLWNALAQGSPLRKPIDEALLKLYEDGKYEEIHKKWFSQGR